MAASRKPAVLSASDVGALLRPGMRVFVEGAAGESLLLREALLAQPEAAAGVHFFGALVPGINDFDYAGLHPTARYTGLFLSPAHTACARLGRAMHLPLGYHQAWSVFESMSFDLVMLQVAAPDALGDCSLGVTADFAVAAARRAASVLAHVNPNMPRTAGQAISWDRLDVVIEQDARLLEVAEEVPDVVSGQIAAHVASLIRDGDCLQFGLGRVPAAVFGLLGSHRDLGVHTGLLPQAAMPLLAKGLLDGARKTRDAGRVVTGTLAGRSGFYQAAADERLMVRSPDYTHDPRVLATIDNLVSINSALEVDLLGQVNAETVGGRQVSGAGGSLDFVRGASLSRGGRSIIALASTTRDGSTRIVRQLAAGTAVTIPRADVDFVVTEYGMADLRSKAAPERAKLLAALAHPDHRRALEAPP